MVTLGNGTGSFTTADSSIVDTNFTISSLTYDVSTSSGGISGSGGSILTFDNGASDATINLGLSVPPTGRIPSFFRTLPFGLTAPPPFRFHHHRGSCSYSTPRSREAGTVVTIDPGTVPAFNRDNPGFTGGVTVNDGTVVLFTSGGIGSGSATLNGGTLSLQNSATSFSNAISVDAAGGNAFNVAGIASTASGYLTGSGGFTKTGSGTLTLSHTNSYSGGTSIAAGMLQLGSVSGVGSGSVTVGSGTIFNVAGFAPVIATLSGAGSVTLGSGTLTAGDSTATSFSGASAGRGSSSSRGAGRLHFPGTTLIPAAPPLLPAF